MRFNLHEHTLVTKIKIGDLVQDANGYSLIIDLIPLDHGINIYFLNLHRLQKFDCPYYNHDKLSKLIIEQ